MSHELEPSDRYVILSEAEGSHNDKLP